MYLNREDIGKLSEGDNIIVTKQDMKKYDITVVRIEGAEIHGIDYTKKRYFILIYIEKTINTK